MKIVIAPDSYKESLSSLEVANAIEAGFKEIFPEAQYHKIPMADGGEGTVEAMIAATNGQLITCSVSNPLGQPIQACYGITGDENSSAIIEMAAASGLALIAPHQRNPLITTSFGTGEMILSALNAGARHFILGVGGSASNDAGVGMMQALGVQYLDEHGNEVGLGGGSLAQLKHIDMTNIDPRIKDCTFEVACDVKNPLIGTNGASAVFGPQKGATPEMVQQLDANLAHFAAIVLQELNIDISHTQGAGAGGGVGAAALVFLKGHLRPGVEIVADRVNLRHIMQNADLVLTGEGRTDMQSIQGKTPVGVAKIAQSMDIPVIAIAGCISNDSAIVHQHGIGALFSVVNRACSLEEAYADAENNVKTAARNIAATLSLGQGLGRKSN